MLQDAPTAISQTPRRDTPIARASDVLDPEFLEAVALGEARLTPQQALELLERAPLHTLGRYADLRCRTLHGDAIRTYIIDRNINYTNVCNAKCTFCAFKRDGHEDDAYTLSFDEIHDKIDELLAIGGTQILMQGGMNPELPLQWYLDLLQSIKAKYPRLHVHAFSPPEFIEFVHFFNPPGDTLRDKLRHVMIQLKEAGLDSLPGGGGEIFAQAVRRKIGLGKCDAEAWLDCMSVAHELGMFTSATMMFGHIEGLADRIHHMALVRERQDDALARGIDGWGHYTAFISWPFQRDNTALGRVPEWGERDPDEFNQRFPGDVVASLDGMGDKSAHKEFGRRLRLAGSTDYLRTQAVSRLFLDNIYSIGASWVTMGPHIGQAALHYGANDMGSVMMEENVVSSAGTTYCLNEAVLCHLLREAGFTPAQRDNLYDVLRVQHGPNAPDLLVRDWSTHRVNRLAQQAPKASAPVTVTTSATPR